eukprot:2863939-Rhodomonas_salina.1
MASFHTQLQSENASLPDADCRSGRRAYAAAPDVGVGVDVVHRVVVLVGTVGDVLARHHPALQASEEQLGQHSRDRLSSGSSRVRKLFFGSSIVNFYRFKASKLLHTSLDFQSSLEIANGCNRL